MYKHKGLIVTREKRDEGMGKMGEGKWEIQDSSYEINKSWG